MQGTKTRFEGRKTLVKGVEINIATQNFTQFEEYIDYTRSLEKAKKVIATQRECDADNNIVISVTELVQEKPKAASFNVSKLLEYGSVYYTEEDAVNALADRPECTIVKDSIWILSGYVWFYDFIDMEYKTKPIAVDKPTKTKAHDIKAVLGFEIEREYEQAIDVDILATHDISQEKLNAWFIIEGEKLNSYCLIED